MNSFEGVKVVLQCGEEIVTIQRDNKPGLRFADMWDLPGGGREGEESPVQTAQREVFEELGILVASDSFYFEKEFPAVNDPSMTAYFLGATISKQEIEAIVFGDEGQGWKLTTVDSFIDDDNAVPFLRTRLKRYRHHIDRAMSGNDQPEVAILES